MLINKNTSYGNISKSNLINQQIDLMTFDILCKYVLQPNIRMEYLGLVKKLLEVLDPTVYENDPEKLKRVKFLSKALEIRMVDGVRDHKLIIVAINGGIDFPIDFIGDNILLPEKDIVCITNMISELLKYRYLYSRIDNFQDIITRFKVSDINNRGNIVLELENAINDIKNEIRKTNVSDDIESMEFSLVDGEFEKSIERAWEIQKNPSRRLVSGMQGLNTMIGGSFESGRVYMFMGTAGSGKSLTLLNLAYQIKKYNNIKPKDPTKRPCIVILTMENTVNETIERLFDMLSGTDGRLCDYDKNEAIKILKQTGVLSITDSSPINIRMIYRHNRSVTTGYLYDLYDDMLDQGDEIVCLMQDHVKRIRSIERDINDVRQELGAIVNEMKSFAEDKQAIVITVTHLNREAERIFQDAKAKGKDAGKAISNANVGESLLMIENVDVAISISDEWRGNEKYLGFKRQKVRNKANASFIFFAQPFVQDGSIRLIEDINGIPQYITSVNGAPELNNGTNSYMQFSGASSIVNNKTIMNNFNKVDNTFSNSSYNLEEDNLDNKQDDLKDKPPAALVFYDENISFIPKALEFFEDKIQEESSDLVSNIINDINNENKGIV